MAFTGSLQSNAFDLRGLEYTHFNSSSYNLWMKNLGSVRISTPEMDLYIECAHAQGHSSRSEWVREALEFYVNQGIHQCDIDRVQPIIDRLAKDGGGRKGDMSAIRAPSASIVEGIQSRAHEASVDRSKWIRAALFFYATRNTG